MEAVSHLAYPGAGKGTQANLLAWLHGFIHFDTGKELEMMLLNGPKTSDPILEREREIFKSGKLNTPEWVLGFVRDKMKQIAQVGMSITFSGSPRTWFEAFGDEKNEGLVEALEKAYGKDHVHFVVIKVKPETAIARNLGRKICAVCKTPVMGNMGGVELKTCPMCGGELKKRVLDTEETMRKRVVEFEARTFPIIEEIGKRGYHVVEIDGEPMPYQVHAEIIKILGYNETHVSK